MRLLDLVSAALEATANGGSARIQLELVLVKAAAPEVDPSTAALLGRIERLEAALARGAAASRPAPAPRRTTDSHAPTPAPATSPPPRRPPEPCDDPRRRDCRAAPGLGGPHGPPPEPERPDPDAGARTGPRARARSRRPLRVHRRARAGDRRGLLAGGDRHRPRGQRDARGAARRCAAGVAGGPRRDDRVSIRQAFLKRKAEQDEYRRATAEALRSVVGAALALRYELADEQTPTRADAADVGFSDDELVRRLVEEFDAQVLDDDQEDS